MRIGVLGTGTVGQAIATRLVGLGHETMMGARDAANPKAATWVSGAAGPGPATAGSFADAVRHGEVVVNATAGTASVGALEAAGGSAALADKILLDVANPLDFSQGMPPTLSVVNTDSLGEQIQRAFPGARVVKTLNTVNAGVMVHPEIVPGEHTMFVAGDEPAAKDVATGLLREFGWSAANIVDLGGIAAARGMEMYLPLWLSLAAALGTPALNVHVVRG
jgi:8-hydroxy-5-deazaflavin:NADPH oxidoreductase